MTKAKTLCENGCTEFCCCTEIIGIVKCSYCNKDAWLYDYTMDKTLCNDHEILCNIHPRNDYWKNDDFIRYMDDDKDYISDQLSQ